MFCRVPDIKLTLIIAYLILMFITGLVYLWWTRVRKRLKRETDERELAISSGEQLLYVNYCFEKVTTVNC